VTAEDNDDRFGTGVTQDANTTTGATTAQADERINYIRNSVKATVDAYDGTVTLYAWDDTDPMLRSWMNAFPGSVKPRSEMSESLLAHVRYPEDMFKVQRDRLSKYHVTDPGAFYNGSDFWVIPKDPSGNTAALQPPYYLTLKMPGQAKATFSLTASYVPKKRSNLAAFVAVSSDVSDYGRIRVLQLPRNTQIDGPETVHNNFQTTPKAKTEPFLPARYSILSATMSPPASPSTTASGRYSNSSSPKIMAHIMVSMWDSAFTSRSIRFSFSMSGDFVSITQRPSRRFFAAGSGGCCMTRARRPSISFRFASAWAALSADSSLAFR